MQGELRKLSGVNVAKSFKINTTKQHTGTDLVNLILFLDLRPGSSDYADCIRGFEQDG